MKNEDFSYENKRWSCQKIPHGS